MKVNHLRKAAQEMKFLDKVTTNLPKIHTFKRQMTSADFETIAYAAIAAVADVDIWAGETHRAAKIVDGDYIPSRCFMAEMKRRLKAAYGWNILV